jgi:hypothetical protein
VAASAVAQRNNPACFPKGAIFSTGGKPLMGMINTKEGGEIAIAEK